MLYERRFECQTRGLIQGPAILQSDIVGGGQLITPGKRKGFEFWNKREFFIPEQMIDLRETKAPGMQSIKTYKIMIRSRETKEEIWVRPFVSDAEAFIVWARLLNLDLERLEQSGINKFNFPTVWIEGELEYVYAVVESFTTTGTTTWTSAGSPYVDGAISVLVQAAGGGGANGQTGNYYGGGGGAGGYRTNTSFAVTLNTGYTVTVGNQNGVQAKGGNSVFGTITSTGGGYGGNAGAIATAGGSGGGGSYLGSNTAGAGNQGGYTPVEGYRGGNYNTGGQGGPGGGSSGQGSDTNSSLPGSGTSNSITGTAVTYGRGGYGNPQGTPTANLGYGGYGGYTGQAGSTGSVHISYTYSIYSFNMPMLGM